MLGYFDKLNKINIKLRFFENSGAIQSNDQFLSWFTSTLLLYKDKPTKCFTHHPILSLQTLETETMSLKSNLETVVELKSSPEKFFTVWKTQAYHIPNHTPDNVHAVDMHEGDWETEGSIKIWRYTVDGKQEVFKEKVVVDEEKNTVGLIGLEGDVMTKYKLFNPTYHLTPKGDGSLARLIIEYEKLDENIPVPDKYMDFMISITRDIDESLAKA
ncbi:LATEX PROTEIN putative-RELATED [Salix purpurea]|uniref:LATEX PROTEIN putative-RELATED n=1 Tax=Salix purpurea TaxID=77065 RepID=A0A9Q0UA81_SALPP|nr:LATEX PROTEIN putative-RELATED [Salix purpurea]